MSNYWCVNFADQAILNHGIEKKLWMMQYQYEDEQNPEFEADGSAQVTINWRGLKAVDVGDKFVAYLPRSTFYATGTVIAPRRVKTATDLVSSVEEYVAQKRSHDHNSGFVYYSPVFYEDFSDEWRSPFDELHRWPQRIDVDLWQNFVPGGIVVKCLHSIPPNEIQKAAFRISKEMFDDISRRLVRKSSHN